MELRRGACPLCHQASRVGVGAPTQVFGALRPSLGKSLRVPPGGDRDELVWPDRCPVRQEGGALELEGRGGAEKFLFVVTPTLPLLHWQPGMPAYGLCRETVFQLLPFPEYPPLGSFLLPPLRAGSHLCLPFCCPSQVSLCFTHCPLSWLLLPLGLSPYPEIMTH